MVEIFENLTQIYYDFPMVHSIFTISVGYPTAYLLYYNKEINNTSKYDNKFKFLPYF